ncbi:MAG TPA: helix-hairpin-helix domain-containing protein [Roseiflexaceae bacterium]|jgi:competence protein ComEA
MRQFSVWMRSRVILFAAGAIILGTLILAWWYIGSGGAAPTVGGAIPLSEDERPGAGDAFPGEDAAPTRASQSDATPTAETAIVYISGAVLRPDVYRVPAAARVKDLVLAAGGLAADADVGRINLAEHVADAQHIHIPREGEAEPAPALADDNTEPVGQGALINLNTASAAELDGLPGIGPALLQRIEEYRTTTGPFQSVEDLRKVKGIGPALFAKLAPLVTVGP